MAKVLISLVGGRPLPNIIVTLHLQPDYLYFVVSQDSLGEGRDYEKTIAALPANLRSSKPFSVRPYVLQDTIKHCQNLIRQHPDDEIIVHATLGPKTMAFGAYDVVKELRTAGRPIDICYLAREGLVWVFEDQTESINISLENYFAGYAWSINFKTDANSDRFEHLISLLVNQLPISQRLLSVLRSADRGRGKRTISYRKLLPDDEYKLLQEIADLQFVSNVRKNDMSVSWTINNDEDGRQLLSGSWLEYYLYQTALAVTNEREQPVFDECGWGIEDAAGKGEIDFAGIFGGQILIASCKTEDSIKRVWFEELHSKAEQLGKGMCSTLLVSTVFRHTRSVRDLQNFSKWADERQIILLMAEDFPRLPTIFKKIVSSNKDAEPKDVPYYPRI